MNRAGLVLTLAVMLVSSPSFAQFGGMGGVGGPSAAVGMVGGGFGGGPFAVGIQRSVQIEMEGGQHLSGIIELRAIVVDGDLGQYAIEPARIKMIRFLKPERDADAGGDGEGGGAAIEKAGNRRAALRVGRGGGMGGGGLGAGVVIEMDGRQAMLTRGKVITSSDKEIIGAIHIPIDFRLDLDFGSLKLAPGKLRSITFTSDNRQDKPTAAAQTCTCRGAPAGSPTAKQRALPLTSDMATHSSWSRP